MIIRPARCYNIGYIILTAGVSDGLIQPTFINPPQPLSYLCGYNKLKNIFYVTDGNIMYLTDASRFLISFVIQHYAPVVVWGGGGTDA